jgi:hypothetical protein
MYGWVDGRIEEGKKEVYTDYTFAELSASAFWDKKEGRKDGKKEGRTERRKEGWKEG